MEEAIDRVDQLVRKNNAKYKGNRGLIQMSKAKRLTNRPCLSINVMRRQK
jgi:hypothetical protein